MFPLEHPHPEAKPRPFRILRRRLPWYIQLIWIALWLFLLAFVVYFLFPAMGKQLIPRP
jgi:hypothetical protein